MTPEGSAVRSDRPPLARILALAVTAGFTAGLAAALFHAVLTEPIIDRAIAFEAEAAALHAGSASMSHDGAATAAHEVVSRTGQRAGLWLGWGALGVTWGALLGALYFLAWRWLPFAGRATWRTVIAAGGWFVLGALPFLKYPANPPGVGDPASIDARLRDFLGLEILAALCVVGAVAIALAARRRGAGWTPAIGCAVAALGITAAALYLLLPDVSQPPGAVPGDVIEEFRRHALVGQIAFWSVFGAVFALLPRVAFFHLHARLPTPVPGARRTPAGA